MGRSEGILPARSPAFERTQLGKYELIARIGEGGMAAVHLARQRGPMNFENTYGTPNDIEKRSVNAYSDSTEIASFRLLPSSNRLPSVRRWPVFWMIW